MELHNIYFQISKGFIHFTAILTRSYFLQAAAQIHAKTLPNLSFPAEVGVNAYVVIHFPVGKHGKYVTKTVARTFTPEFSYKADLLVPILVPTGATGSGNISLAEQLEDSEMLLEVW